MALKTNILANYLGRGWSSASVFVFVPFYIHLLGAENYGLVAFYSVMFGVVSISNMGMSSTLMRELAKNSVSVELVAESRNLLRTIELLFLAIAATSAFAVYAVSKSIAAGWLHNSGISLAHLTVNIQLMGVAMALRLPIDMYYSGLNGLQRQIASNSLQAIFTTLRNAVTILVLYSFSSAVEAFFVCQAVSNLVELALVRQLTWTFLSQSNTIPCFSVSIIKRIYPYTLGMASISVTSMLLTQVDKLVVSKFLSMEAFGAYSVASLLSRVPLILVQPIADAVHPRLTQLVAEQCTDQLRAVYLKTCMFLAVVVYPAGAVVAVFSDTILRWWSQSSELASSASSATMILTIGSIFIAALMVPYYLALAHGWTSLNLSIGVCSLILILPLTIVLTRMYGLTGASAGWLVLNAGILVPYILILHRYTLPQVNSEWFIRCNFIPLLISVLVVLCFRRLSREAETEGVVALAWAFAAWAVASACVVIGVRETRELLILTMRQALIASGKSNDCS